MNMAKKVVDGRKPENFNFEPIMRRLKSDIFDWDQV